MYVPPDAVPAAQIAELIRIHPPAPLVTNGSAVPHTTNLPVVPCEDTLGEPVGSTLLGHVNRANPHWGAAEAGTPAKIVSPGPGAYISPGNYQADPSAPTWDFVTAHISGTLSRLPAGDTTPALVTSTATLLEQELGDHRDPSGSHDHFRSIVHDAGAFEFRIEAAGSMFELSREKSPAIQRRLIDRFCAHEPGPPRAGLADHMRGFGLGGQQ